MQLDGLQAALCCLISPPQNEPVDMRRISSETAESCEASVQSVPTRWEHVPPHEREIHPVLLSFHVTALLYTPGANVLLTAQHIFDSYIIQSDFPI